MLLKFAVSGSQWDGMYLEMEEGSENTVSDCEHVLGRILERVT